MLASKSKQNSQANSSKQNFLPPLRANHRLTQSSFSMQSASLQYAAGLPGTQSFGAPVSLNKSFLSMIVRADPGCFKEVGWGRGWYLGVAGLMGHASSMFQLQNWNLRNLKL